MNILDELKREFKQGTALNRIIFINIGVFVGIGLLSVIFDLFGLNTGGWSSPDNWVAMPSNLNELPSHFWTPITYMFTHFGFIHLLFNLLWLYWFSKFFLQIYSQQQLVSLYLTGGLAGAVMFLLSYNLLPYFAGDREGAILLGASASVLAIVIAAATTVPNQQIQLMFIGQVKLKHLALAMVVIDLLSITKGNAGGHLAHLGGALWGYLFVVARGKGLDLLKWVSILVAVGEGLFKPKPKKAKMKVKWNRPATEQDYRNDRKSKTNELDEILDKIKSSGYESLSKEEKQKLFNASNK